MGRDYALDRIAFGRAIGSFQAVKHMLADMYVSATLARSNSYYGAWALSTNAAELPEAAASRSMAAWASPGSSTATCTIAAPMRWRSVSAACPIGKTS
jgi:alkylation response protein AidB-like acyl-CoA dehydrogenase